MKRIVSLVFVSFLLSAISAQQGSPLLTHFSESREIENQSWAICQDDNQVMLFATRKGILTFDGEEWKTVRLPTIPYAMQRSPADGRIYIGGDNNFGYLTRDSKGIYNYVSLSGDSAGTGIITRIAFSISDVWFYSDESVSRYNIEKQKLDLRIKSESGNPFSGIVITPKNVFINVLYKGLFRLESDTLFPIVTGYLTEKTDILFSLPYNKSLVLVGQSDGSLSLFDGLKFNVYKMNDEGYLRQNILSEGITIGDTAYAFSTLGGGAMVIEKKSRKILFTINNQNELPDDEVFAIGSDNSGGLWLSHQYGLTRADLSLPISNYTIFPGLKGNLTCALRYNNELYVSTSEGVFYLAEVKSYNEVEIFVKTEPVIPPPLSVNDFLVQEQQANRKNIFARIFGKKTVREKAPLTLPPEIKPVTEYTRKKISKLKSVSYVYSKVTGLDEKCRQLISTPFGILAATNNGLYNIIDHNAKVVISGRYINFISWQPFDGKYFVSASDGYFSVRSDEGKIVTDQPDPQFTGAVYSVLQKDTGSIWLSGDNVAYRAESLKSQMAIKYSSYNVTRDFPERYYLNLINDTIFLITESGIHYFNDDAGRFESYEHLNTGSDVNSNRVIPLSNRHLIKNGDEWMSLDSKQGIKGQELSLLKIFDEIKSVYVEDKYLWVIGEKNKLFAIDRSRYSVVNPAGYVFIKRIYNNRGTRFDLNNVMLDRGDNVINFDIIAPDYLKQNTTRYQYYINKVMSDWSTWSTTTHYVKSITKPGEYILRVRAKDLWGNIGQTQSVRFTITAPFTKTPAFYLLSGFIILVLIIFIVLIREKRFQVQNRILEEKVKERTAEIEAQKGEITSSIAYAGRIQRAMLPMDIHFEESFSDYFIIFRPRDIVSGDFYWIGEDDKSIFFTVADCTGHGVPGAFMSTMGISTLNEIIANNRNLQANTVLNLLREKTMRALHQTGKEGEATDGMDISFCVLNKNRRTLQYSGAFNPMFIFQGGELKEYRADRMPIGIHYGDETSFTNHVVTVNRGDTVYIFSDGFAGQFGGPEGVKYRSSNFKKLLSEIYYRPMVEQRNILENEFATWKGLENQVDDITIIGIRI